MNDYTKEIRNLINQKPPLQRVAFIQSFGLTEEEENCILLKEVRGKSVVQISDKLLCSPQTVYRRRKSGFLKIYQSLHH